MLAGQFNKLNHPTYLDTRTLRTVIQSRGITLAQLVGKPSRVTRQSARVEFVSAPVAKHNLNIFCLVHGVGVADCGVQSLFLRLVSM